MEQFEGKWKQVKAENMDAYLKAVGVSFLLRKLAGAATVNNEFRKEADGQWTIVFSSPIKSGSFTFKLGEETDEVTPDGRKRKSTVTVVDGKIIQTQKAANANESSVLERYMEGDKMITVCTCGKVVARFEDVRI